MVFLFLKETPQISHYLPCCQVARAILENPKDKTKIRLISANVAEDDILLKVIFILFT